MLDRTESTLLSDDVVVTVLYYYPEENYFTDEDGFVIYDIFQYISPWELALFKEYRESCYIDHGRFGIVELVHYYMYPEEEDLI